MNTPLEWHLHQVLWRVVRPFLDPRTSAKVKPHIRTGVCHSPKSDGP